MEGTQKWQENYGCIGFQGIGIPGQKTPRSEALQRKPGLVVRLGVPGHRARGEPNPGLGGRRKRLGLKCSTRHCMDMHDLGLTWISEACYSFSCTPVWEEKQEWLEAALEGSGELFFKGQACVRASICPVGLAMWHLQLLELQGWGQQSWVPSASTDQSKDIENPGCLVPEEEQPGSYLQWKVPSTVGQ